MKKALKKGALALSIVCLAMLTPTVVSGIKAQTLTPTERVITFSKKEDKRRREDTPKPLPETGEEELKTLALTAATLRQGASGKDVKEVQRRLKQWGYYSGSVDGVFGAATKKAVIAFQKKNGLTADGIVGKATFEALGINASSGGGSGAGSTTNGLSSSDLYLLARTIYAEGRGEPYTGQVAIGAVVMNRIRSPQFPNTVAGVVYQKHAFTAVSDGQINLTPNETAMKAARDAMNGWDPTGGALYYYNPAVATSAWIFDRQTVTVIGKHVFAI